MDKTYKYLGYFLLLLIPLIFAGFYKTYFQPFPNFKKDIDFYIHIHAAIAALWVAILIAQPFLIINEKKALHRKIGKLTYFIFSDSRWTVTDIVLVTGHLLQKENCQAHAVYDRICVGFTRANFWTHWPTPPGLERIINSKCSIWNYLYNTDQSHILRHEK